MLATLSHVIRGHVALFDLVSCAVGIAVMMTLFWRYGSRARSDLLAAAVAGGACGPAWMHLIATSRGMRLGTYLALIDNPFAIPRTAMFASLQGAFLGFVFGLALVGLMTVFAKAPPSREVNLIVFDQPVNGLRWQYSLRTLILLTLLAAGVSLFARGITKGSLRSVYGLCLFISMTGVLAYAVRKWGRLPLNILLGSFAGGSLGPVLYQLVTLHWQMSQDSFVDLIQQPFEIPFYCTAAAIGGAIIGIILSPVIVLLVCAVPWRKAPDHTAR